MDSSGLYFAQARRYDASTGRFVSEDLVRGFIFTPYTQNHYSYCWNNPEEYVDRDGYFATVVAGAIVGGLIGGISETISVWNDDSISTFQKAGKVLLHTVSGVGEGAIVGTGAGVLVLAGASVGIDSAVNIGDQMINNKKFSFMPDKIDYRQTAAVGVESFVLNFAFGSLFMGIEAEKVGGSVVESLKNIEKNINLVTDDVAKQAYKSMFMKNVGTQFSAWMMIQDAAIVGSEALFDNDFSGEKQMKQNKNAIECLVY